MRLTESFNRNCLQEKKRIIVYGAGRYGELAFHGLKALGITVDFFVDRSLCGKKFLGAEVISPDNLGDYAHDIFLIASLNYFQDMYLNLKSIDAEYVYDILDLLKLDYDESALSEYLLDEKHNISKYENVINNMDLDKLIVNHVELVLTEKCSLRCKDCANLMQYYQAPEHIPCAEIIETFDRFLDAIDCLLDLRLLGGEPFLYKDLDKILERYKDDDRIKRITIYTNSTIIPSDAVLKSLSHKKVFVHQSNYGAVSRKVNELDSLFTMNNVQHYIHVYEKWLDVGIPERHNYTEDALKEIFNDCIMAKCFSFYRGRLYLCPRAAHGGGLGFFKNKDNEFVDFNECVRNRDEKRSEISAFMQKSDYIEACRYCNGSSSRTREIDAAVQMRN